MAERARRVERRHLSEQGRRRPHDVARLRSSRSRRRKGKRQSDAESERPQQPVSISRVARGLPRCGSSSSAAPSPRTTRSRLPRAWEGSLRRQGAGSPSSTIRPARRSGASSPWRAGPAGRRSLAGRTPSTRRSPRCRVWEVCTCYAAGAGPSAGREAAEAVVDPTRRGRSGGRGRPAAAWNGDRILSGPDALLLVFDLRRTRHSRRPRLERILARLEM
jgi:hypothetical protein